VDGVVISCSEVDWLEPENVHNMFLCTFYQAC